MKKLLLSALLLAGAASYASAEEVVVFSDDFEYIQPWSEAFQAGATIEENNHSAESPNLTKKVEGATLYSVLQEKGYGFVGFHAETKTERTPDKQIYFNKNYLKFGLTGYQSGIVMPAFEAPANSTVTIAFDFSSQRQGSGIWDPTQIAAFVVNGADTTTYAITPKALEENAPYEWIPVSVTLEGATINNDTKITIVNVKEQWGSGKALRWYMDNLKIAYTENAGGNEGEGDVWLSENFDKMFEPWYETLSLTDPMGTNDTTGDLGVSITTDAALADGTQPKHAFFDRTLIRTEDHPELASKNGFLAWVLDGGAHANYSVFRMHKGYLRVGVDNIMTGIQLPKVTVPEDAENVFIEFDWCPVKDANGEYSEAVLEICEDQGQTFIPEIHHNMATGDAYAWKHECFNLYEDCENFTPRPIRFMICPSEAAGQKEDGKKLNTAFYIDNIRIASKKSTGVSNIAIEDNSNAPVEYYNLQGVRVANPENGLYIRRQGNKATKVVIR